MSETQTTSQPFGGAVANWASRVGAYDLQSIVRSRLPLPGQPGNLEIRVISVSSSNSGGYISGRFAFLVEFRVDEPLHQRFQVGYRMSDQEALFGSDAFLTRQVLNTLATLIIDKCVDELSTQRRRRRGNMSADQQANYEYVNVVEPSYMSSSERDAMWREYAQSLRDRSPMSAGSEYVQRAFMDESIRLENSRTRTTNELSAGGTGRLGGNVYTITADSSVESIRRDEDRQFLESVTRNNEGFFEKNNPKKAAEDKFVDLLLKRLQDKISVNVTTESTGGIVRVEVELTGTLSDGTVIPLGSDFDEMEIEQ